MRCDVTGNDYPALNTVGKENRFLLFQYNLCNSAQQHSTKKNK